MPAALARGETLLRQTAGALSHDLDGIQLVSSAVGLLYSYGTADRAASFAVRLQEALLTVAWPETLLVRPEAAVERSADGLVFRGLRAKIALHRAGPGELDEVFEMVADGPATYQVARIAGVAHGGQVLASDVFVAELADDGAHSSADLGAHTLTGVDGESHLFEICPRSLSGRTFPDNPTQTVRKSNVAVGTSVLLGRHGDLAALSELLSLGVRRISVIGSDGLGKSQLVHHFARARTGDPRFFGGVWLAPVDGHSVGHLVRAVGWSLGIALEDAAEPSVAVQRLGWAIAARGPLLLVIDGLVDPMPEARQAVEQWLVVAPQLTVVANTLGSAPVCYEVRPMPVSTADSARHSDAVRMYASHARAVDEDFAVDHTAPIAEIVARVGGRPAPLRLLAGFVDRIPPDHQLALISVDGFAVGDLLDRLLALLDGQEAATLLAAAVLAGSFDVDALEDVGADPLAVLERLERRGLVRGQPDLGATFVYRYQVEEWIRQRVLARLPKAEQTALAARRANLVLLSCERFARAAGGSDHPEVVARIAAEREGLLQVVELGLDPSSEDPASVHLALRSCLALEPVLDARGPSFLALEISDRVLRRSDAVLGCDPLLQQRLLVMRARALRKAGRLAAARADLERAASIAERWSDGEGGVDCRIEQALVFLEQGEAMEAVAQLRPIIATPPTDPARNARALAVLGRASGAALLTAEAERLLRFAVDEQRRLGRWVDAAQSLGWLAAIHRAAGHLEEALQSGEQAAAHRRRLGMRAAESSDRIELGLLHAWSGEADLAQDAFVEATRAARAAGDRKVEARALRSWGLLALLEDQGEQARELFLEAMAMDRDRGDRGAEGADMGYLGLAAHLADQADAALTSYRRAVQLLAEAHRVPLAAMFGAWSAALAAEHGEAAAQELYQAALERHAEDPDAEVAEVLHQLRGTLDLLEAARAAERGEAEVAERWHRSAQDRWEEASQAVVPLPILAQLAHRRVGDRLSQ